MFCRKFPISSRKLLQYQRLKGTGMAELLKMIEVELFENFVDTSVQIPFTEGQLISLFHEQGHVKGVEHNRKGVFIQGQLPGRLLAQFTPFNKKEPEPDPDVFHRRIGLRIKQKTSASSFLFDLFLFWLLCLNPALLFPGNDRNWRKQCAASAFHHNYCIAPGCTACSASCDLRRSRRPFESFRFGRGVILNLLSKYPHPSIL